MLRGKRQQESSPGTKERGFCKVEPPVPCWGGPSQTFFVTDKSSANLLSLPPCVSAACLTSLKKAFQRPGAGAVAVAVAGCLLLFAAPVAVAVAAACLYMLKNSLLGSSSRLLSSLGRLWPQACRHLGACENPSL